MSFPRGGKTHKVRRMRWLCLFALMFACSSSSSQLSDAGTCQTADCAPPTGLAVRAGNQFALIQWNAAGASVIDYRVTVSSAAGVLVHQSARTSLLFPGLANGVPYQVTVASTIASGTGPPSAPVVVTPQVLCDRGFALYRTFPAGTAPSIVVAADFDNDGFPDLAVTQAAGVSVLRNDQLGNFDSKTDYPLATSPGFLVAADFDSSGLPDLAIGGASTTLFHNDGTGKFDGGVDLGFASTTLATGDFNQSGLPGLAAASAGSTSVRIFAGGSSADGGLSDAGTVALGLVPGFLAVGDFNADTIADLAAVNASQPADGVVLSGTDAGTYSAPASLTTGSNALSLAAGDFNADGLSDLATGGADGQLHVQLNLDGGTFSAQQAFDAGAVPDFLVAADLDLDGFSDLVYTASTQNRLGVLMNAQDGGFANPMLFPTGGHPSSVAVADFNNDGFPDLAVANAQDGTIGIYISVCR